jgi:hypothetical protein
MIRPTNSIPILFFTLYVMLQHKRYFFQYTLWALAVAVPFLIFNLHLYGTLLSPYYAPDRITPNPRIFEALAGNLVSPARGLFIYSPILLLSVYGAWLKVKREKFNRLDVVFLAVVILHWITISSYSHWWGGHSFGPRFFSDMIPFLIYFLFPVVVELARQKGARKAVLVTLFIGLLTMSFLIHLQGATSTAVYDWNNVPVNIDADPARVWDWKDIQFMRGVF